MARIYAVEYPENPIVPYGDIVHDRAVLELFRGCIRGCRFCQAGFLYSFHIDITSNCNFKWPRPNFW